MILIPTPRRAPAENIVPMINVVFLLLIFFLMTAAIAPPDPVVVTPPMADADREVPADGRLYLARDGTLAYGDLRGEPAVLAAAQAAARAAARAAEPAGRVLVMADGAAGGADLARLLARLAGLGAPEVWLVTTPAVQP